MRDFERIMRITTKLMNYWASEPDWRFGQLISNVQSWSGIHDLFYIEDDDFEKILDSFFSDGE